jgi:hypothetical protein
LNSFIKDENKATAAPKLSTAEARIDFDSMTAKAIHNKGTYACMICYLSAKNYDNKSICSMLYAILARGFSEWPGIWSNFIIRDNVKAWTIIELLFLRGNELSQILLLLI